MRERQRESARECQRKDLHGGEREQKPQKKEKSSRIVPGLLGFLHRRRHIAKGSGDGESLRCSSSLKPSSAYTAQVRCRFRKFILCMVLNHEFNSFNV